ncbi:transposase, partial [Bifidobacterium pseudolongum subsp. globosum]
MKKNGKTSAGRTRWRCKDTGCGASRSRAYDRQADDVRAFLNWLLSADTQEGRGVSARTLRRRNELGWSLWPPCPMDGQVHDVVHLDGIHLGRNAVVLIAYGDGHVLGWYVARRETSAAWENL